MCCFFFFFSSRRRHTRCSRDWSSDVCSSDLQHCFTVGIVIALAAITGQAMLGSGAADRIVNGFLALLGEKRSEERRVGKSVDLGGRRIIKKKKRRQRYGDSQIKEKIVDVYTR